MLGSHGGSLSRKLHAELPFQTVLADAVAVPVYQRIASKALHLQQLGLCRSAIARRLGVTAKKVVKALAWLARSRQAEQSGAD
jgi:hypothetical protein